MAYNVILHPSAAKSLRSYPRKIQERIVEAAEKLRGDPRPHGYRKLTGRNDQYRIRVGNYRIIYTIDDAARIVEVGIIADRKDAYRD